METNRLLELIGTKIELRDEKWEDEFLAHSAQGRFHVVQPEPIAGPDGWPYLLVENIPSDVPSEPAINILAWLSTRGIGLVINPKGELPDFVLSYGMIWNYRERGNFISREPHADSGQAGSESLDLSTIKFFEKNLSVAIPDYARKILRDFFADQGIFAPKALLVRQTENQSYNIAISIESLGAPKTEEYPGIGEAISWFLPSHYPILLMSEKVIPHFQLL